MTCRACGNAAEGLCLANRRCPRIRGPAQPHLCDREDWNMTNGREIGTVWGEWQASKQGKAAGRIYVIERLERVTRGNWAVERLGKSWRGEHSPNISFTSARYHATNISDDRTAKGAHGTVHRVASTT